MWNLRNLKFKGIDNRLDLSVSAVSGSFSAEVKFHVLLKWIIKIY